MTCAPVRLPGASPLSRTLRLIGLSSPAPICAGGALFTHELIAAEINYERDCDAERALYCIVRWQADPSARHTAKERAMLPHQTESNAASAGAKNVSVSSGAASTDGARARRPWVPMLLGVAAGALLCAGALAAGALLAPRTPDPTPAARALCADLISRNFDALYALLSPRQQSAGTRAQFVASQRQLDLLRGATSACMATITGTSGGVANATLTMRRGAAAEQMANVSLILTGSGWRVDVMIMHSWVDRTRASAASVERGAILIRRRKGRPFSLEGELLAFGAQQPGSGTQPACH